MDQSQGAVRERLERALPGNGVSGRKTGLLGLGLVGSEIRLDEEDDSGMSNLDLDPDNKSM